MFVSEVGKEKGMVIAIDPGPVNSALVTWDGERLHESRHSPNEEIRELLLAWNGGYGPDPCVIEMIASYGMPVGAEVFATCVWIGRFMEAYGPKDVELTPRLAVKMHLCHTARANDSNIRTALIDRFGGKEKAIGRKASPGPLYGVSGDQWAALALAVTWMDQKGA